MQLPITQRLKFPKMWNIFKYHKIQVKKYKNNFKNT